MVFNLPEPNTNIKSKRDTLDKSEILELASQCDVELKSDNIKQVTRLGKKEEGKSEFC